ncbi:hypothetical protein CHS0354_008282 [Potamilus streckersoni]|uniref:G-protein coupled receptors family 1 profile domain-containing protein n=1 Tax=Potamilus streckersoni TaxID=2493646 RepID=A0AAE0SIP4_9BIVA|nr:hypothetical protein CHS0354_008282 [Potamilus streckersoni]
MEVDKNSVMNIVNTTLVMDDHQSLDKVNEKYALFLIPVTVIFGLFTVLGVIGNILVLVVFFTSSHYKRNNFKVFVICIGLIDLMTSVSLIPAEIVKHRNYFSFENVHACKVKCFFNIFASTSAALALLIVCIDRFRKVCQPLKKQISPSLAIKLCIVSVALAVFLSLPGGVMCGIEANNMNSYDGRTNGTVVYFCSVDPSYKGTTLRIMYKYMFLVLIVAVSFAMILMYAFVGRGVCAYWKARPALHSVRSVTSESESEALKSMADHNAVSRTGSAASKGTQNTDVDSISLNGSNRQKLRLAKTTRKSNDSSSLKEKITSWGKGQNLLRNISRQSSFGNRKFPYKTMIWFLLTLIFIITYIIYVILSMYFVPDNIVKMSPGKFVFYSCIFRLYFINNIINPFVYAALDSRFRRACLNLFRIRKSNVI